MRSTMSRPDPIQYAERLYTAIRAANFSPISFLAFGNAVKDGVDFRRMPRMAAEPFMRVVGEMLDLEEETTGSNIVEADVSAGGAAPREGFDGVVDPTPSVIPPFTDKHEAVDAVTDSAGSVTPSRHKRDRR
jgi:hypothetical protein